jgi:hypothetical protein
LALNLFIQSYVAFMSHWYFMEIQWKHQFFLIQSTTTLATMECPLD